MIFIKDYWSNSLVKTIGTKYNLNKFVFIEDDEYVEYKSVRISLGSNWYVFKVYMTRNLKKTRQCKKQ